MAMDSTQAGMAVCSLEQFWIQNRQSFSLRECLSADSDKSALTPTCRHARKYQHPTLRTDYSFLLIYLCTACARKWHIVGERIHAEICVTVAN
jgi:hypothetical protein